MRKVYNYENCKVVVHIPDDDQFQERLLKASEKFMKKVFSERMNSHVNINQTATFREE